MCRFYYKTINYCYIIKSNVTQYANELKIFITNHNFYFAKMVTVQLPFRVGVLQQKKTNKRIICRTTNKNFKFFFIFKFYQFYWRVLLVLT